MSIHFLSWMKTESYVDHVRSPAQLLNIMKTTWKNVIVFRSLWYNLAYGKETEDPDHD